MKTKNIFLVLFIFLVATGFSQKIDKQKLEFEYNQLPKKPLNKSIKNYSSQLEMAYEADIIAEKQKAQDDFEKATTEHPQKVKDAEAKHKEIVAEYEADMKAWKEKSTGSKIVERTLLDEKNKPVKPGDFRPSMAPRLKIVYHQKIFNKETLANTYLKLSGYKKSTENAVKITATLQGFENLEQELKSREGNFYNKQTKTTTKTFKYWYEVSHRHPINLKIETPDGEVILDEILEQFNEYTIAKSSSKEGKAPSFNINKFAKILQDKIVQSNMKSLEEYINSNYGFSKVKRNITVYRVNAKKLNYDDYQKAFESTTAGYNLLVSDNTSAIEKIKSAIAIWEKALTESNPSDKKARVNSDITIITLFNLVEACIWTNNYNKSEEYLNKIVGLNPSKKETKLIDEYREFLKEHKERWEANK